MNSFKHGSVSLNSITEQYISVLHVLHYLVVNDWRAWQEYTSRPYVMVDTPQPAPSAPVAICLFDDSPFDQILMACL